MLGKVVPDIVGAWQFYSKVKDLFFASNQKEQETACTAQGLSTCGVRWWQKRSFSCPCDCLPLLLYCHVHPALMQSMQFLHGIALQQHTAR